MTEAIEKVLPSASLVNWFHGGNYEVTCAALDQMKRYRDDLKPLFETLLAENERLKADATAKDEAFRQRNVRIRDLVAKATERNATIDKQAKAIRTLRSALQMYADIPKTNDVPEYIGHTARKALTQTEEWK